MKSCLFALCFVMSGIAAFSQQYLLLPDEFYPAKGQSVGTKLLTGREFSEMVNMKYQSSNTAAFWLYEGSKKTDLKAVTTDSLSPVNTRKFESAGLAMLSMERRTLGAEMNKSEFITYLQEESLAELTDKVENTGQSYFKEKQTFYLKTLLAVDKASGNIYSQKLGHDLEILLLQNPCKMMYGDDLTAQLLFKGKPLNNALVAVYTKGPSGKTFTTTYSSDLEGKIYFKLNRSGTWMINTVHMEPAEDKKIADYDSWRANYTFGFKEQGIGG